MLDCRLFICWFATKQTREDGSVSEVLALQAKGSELGYPAPGES